MQKIFLDHTSSNAYKISNELSDKIWDLVSTWSWFAKQTMGIQLVKSIDSVVANTVEAFGRFHKKDKEKFYYNARESAFETILWLEKAFKRGLISKKDFDILDEPCRSLPKEINWLIRITEIKLKD